MHIVIVALKNGGSPSVRTTAHPFEVLQATLARRVARGKSRAQARRSSQRRRKKPWYHELPITPALVRKSAKLIWRGPVRREPQMKPSLRHRHQLATNGLSLRHPTI